MNNKMPIALAVVLLTIAAACHKDNKEAQLKALDNAYKSGVFTEEEYDAKKQALMGPPPVFGPEPGGIASGAAGDSTRAPAAGNRRLPRRPRQRRRNRRPPRWRHRIRRKEGGGGGGGGGSGAALSRCA